MKSKPIALPKPQRRNQDAYYGSNAYSREPVSPSGNDDRQVLLSKSLGDVGGMTALFLNGGRRSSEVSDITYAGYLLKRSNQPYKAVTPFPPMIDYSMEFGELKSNENSYEVSSNDLRLGEKMQEENPSLLQPKPRSLADSLGADLDTPDSYPPKQPLHMLLKEQQGRETAPTMTTSEGKKGEDNNEVEQQQQKSTQQSIEYAASCAAHFFGLPYPDSAAAENQYNSVVVAAPAVDSLEAAATSTAAMIANAVSVPPRSSPIKVTPTSDNCHVAPRESFETDALHRQVSAPCVLNSPFAQDYANNDADDANASFSSSNHQQHPPDVIDPEDGHIWRAKYCILEDGILYFYRNETDAKSLEAVSERQSAALSTPAPSANNPDNFSAIDLSKSPMARLTLFEHGIGAGSFGANNDTSVMWEKRVALNCVGAVRSAELEYGTNSFELLAVEDEEGQQDQDDFAQTSSVPPENKLVLRARNPDEMNEWLFQFHRSLASFVMNMMDLCVESYKPSYLGDIHHPQVQDLRNASQSLRQSTEIGSMTPKSAATASPFLSYYNMPFSPRFLHPPVTPTTPALSHGHGRSALHRRRIGQRTKSFDVESSSSSIGEKQGLQGANSNSNNNIATVSPLQFNISMTPKTLPPIPRHPSPLQVAQQKTKWDDGGEIAREQEGMIEIPTSVGFVNDKDIAPASTQMIDTPLLPTPPELSVPQSACPPETERPLPAKKTTGKYIPPHLRRKVAQQNESENDKESSAKVAPKKKYVPPHLRNKAPTDTNKPPIDTNIAPTDMNKPPTDTNAEPYVPRYLRQTDDSDLNGNDPPLITLVPVKLEDENLYEEQMKSKLKPNETLTPMANRVISYEQLQLLQLMESPTKEVERDDQNSSSLCQMGGCADPRSVTGSILDTMFIPRKASRVGQVQMEPFGVKCGGTGLQWEVGAASVCGVRDSNEDSYLIANNLMDVFDGMRGTSENGTNNVTEFTNNGENDVDKILWGWSKRQAGAPNNVELTHPPGLFAIFDGHCGDHAARFGAEKLPYFLLQESENKKKYLNKTTTQNEGAKELDVNEGACFSTASLNHILRKAITKLDTEFCNLCVEGGREWESGATALIAMLVNEHLIIANIGDCRGVICREVDEQGKSTLLNEYCEKENSWNELSQSSSSEPFDQNQKSDYQCFWREVAEIHSPSREDERKRIEKANGWTTTEKEIPIGQLKRMDFLDEDVIEILKRCFEDRYHDGKKACHAAPQRILQISRVCGELAVSRAIGDRDFKAAFNVKQPSPSECNINDDSSSYSTNKFDSMSWECPLFLPFPENHNGQFVGDLVSGSPDLYAMRVGEEHVKDEFLLLACDGLWDVMDADDAVRVARDLLFEKEWTAKKAAARLAELAVHLGSSDNITVIVLRFFRKTN